MQISRLGSFQSVSNQRVPRRAFPTWQSTPAHASPRPQGRVHCLYTLSLEPPRLFLFCEWGKEGSSHVSSRMLSRNFGVGGACLSSVGGETGGAVALLDHRRDWSSASDSLHKYVSSLRSEQMTRRRRAIDRILFKLIITDDPHQMRVEVSDQVSLPPEL